MILKIDFRVKVFKCFGCHQVWISELERYRTGPSVIKYPPKLSFQCI